MAVKVDDLGHDYELRPSQRMVLQCPYGCEYSADKNDYFWMRSDDVFRCNVHKELMTLMAKETVYTTLKE